jgi:GH25 family lysozyme M1 (1,4-beta-N-acetylmuramidase)
MLWHGLDISHWDGDIDLAAWKRKRGIKFVIVKCGGNERGLGRYKDPKFEENYKKAVAAGLHVGAYYYGVSTDTANARADADHCAQLLAGKTFDMPIYYDVEDGQQLAIGQRALTDVVKAFCDRIGVLGYCAGLYTGGDAYRGQMYGVEELSKYADWIAWWREAWPTECGDVGMHQVGGISITGDVVYDDVAGHHDYDRCIIDYPSRIKPKPDPAPVPDPEPAGDESGTVEKLMSVAYAELGYYAPSDPERGSKYGRWLAELTGEDWLAGPSTSIWWCCMYVSYVLYHAGVTVKGFPTQNTDLALNGGAPSY